MDRGRGRSTGRSATTRPGRADRTTIRSATRIASAMLWVTSTIVGRGPLPEAQQLEVEALAGQRVEGAERLVEQQHLGLEGEGPGQGDPLARSRRTAPPAGWRATPGSRATSSARARQPLAPPVGRPAGELERVGDVVGGRAPRQQARLLEDEADARIRAVDRRAVEADVAGVRAAAGRR